MAEALFKVLKWRWLAKRVFSSFQPAPTSTSPSTSTSASTSSSTSPPPPQPSPPSPPPSKASSPSYWPFGRLFTFKYFRPALPPPPIPPAKPAEEVEAQDQASSSEIPSVPAPSTPPLAPEAVSSSQSPSPLSITASASSPPIALPTSTAPIPLQLPTPPATPEPRQGPPPQPSQPSQIHRQPYLSHLPPLPPIQSKMSDLPTLHTKLISSFTARTHTSTLPLLSTAKITLLKASALVPSANTVATNPHLLSQARDILEIGALTSIYLSDTESFSRYYAYLQPFYKLPTTVLPASQQEGKILGLYLLFLLSQGDAAGFHTALEVLNQEGSGDSEKGWQWGDYVRYPVTLERWLMEGSYDKVWEATRKGKTPADEFDVFTKILVQTLRLEIATSAQRAYPSLPISNAKNLLFLDTEKEVLQFARERDWEIRDGRIYFPPDEEYDGADIPDTASVAAVKSAIHSGAIIENTIGYANELEQIV
ncbi:regulatory particle non-ATPase [Arthrobotrys megalospora]